MSKSVYSLFVVVESKNTTLDREEKLFLKVDLGSSIIEQLCVEFEIGTLKDMEKFFLDTFFSSNEYQLKALDVSSSHFYFSTNIKGMPALTEMLKGLENSVTFKSENTFEYGPAFPVIKTFRPLRISTKEKIIYGLML